MNTPDPVQPAELLSQLTTLIADVDAIRADAEQWQELKRGAVEELGYGPKLTARQILDLLPNALTIAEIAADTQEVQPPAAAPKSARSPRSHVTDELRRRIWDLHDQEETNIRIAEKCGCGKTTVNRVLAAGRPG